MINLNYALEVLERGLLSIHMDKKNLEDSMFRGDISSDLHQLFKESIEERYRSLETLIKIFKNQPNYGLDEKDEIIYFMDPNGRTINIPIKEFQEFLSYLESGREFLLKKAFSALYSDFHDEGIDKIKKMIESLEIDSNCIELDDTKGYIIKLEYLKFKE